MYVEKKEVWVEKKEYFNTITDNTVIRSVLGQMTLKSQEYYIN